MKRGIWLFAGILFWLLAMSPIFFDFSSWFIFSAIPMAFCLIMGVIEPYEEYSPFDETAPHIMD